jgi:bifunctional NMN adenylyltransferase/nudix hydrolase
MSERARFAVFMGRFQPLHLDHLEVMKEGLKIAEHLIILVGSSNQARSIKNPWTFDERATMIDEALAEEYELKDDLKTGFRAKGPWTILPLRDHFYNDDIWAMSVQKKVRDATKNCNESEIVLLGSWKDESSYYLKYFPQWKQHVSRPKGNLNATDIRNAIFSQQGTLYCNHKGLHRSTVNFLDKLMDFEPATFEPIAQEYDMIETYKKAWKAAPYPPTFVTVDSVVICQGHVLVVKRQASPGKGLWAIPGGFLEQNELIVDGAIRELKEETGIKVPKPVLKSKIVDSHVFDYPGRSLRGRTITHAFSIRLNVDENGNLPMVSAGSDAEKCYWMDFSEIHDNEDKFFEDHYSIIQYFLNRPV